MAKRILWLFNHTSLRKFEVPMLIEMGYEVYCPKKWDILDFSASVTYEYDSSLTIPKEDIDKLNGINFYKIITHSDMQLVNKYFDIAICIGLGDLIYSLARSFAGAICFQAFGLTEQMRYTHGLGYNLLEMLERCGNRFWFVSAYDNLHKPECALIQKRYIYMPIGLSNTDIKQTWVGGDKRILFISPKIKTDKYYGNIYREFNKQFGDLPHVIGGAQLQPVSDDDTVVGFLSSDEYEYNMNHLAAMFYHSEEPRHLHYHPLEAIKQGMPLVFMAGGMLEHISNGEMPGCATNIKEARVKLKKLMDGNKKFIEEVQESQSILLEPFKMEYCREYWIKGMRKIEESLPIEDNQFKIVKKKRIAVVLPCTEREEDINYSIRFTLALNKIIQTNKENVELIFAYPDEKSFVDSDGLYEIKKNNISCRSYVNLPHDSIWMDKTLQLSGYKADSNYMLPQDECIALHDGIADFRDCDHIIFTNDIDSDDKFLFSLVPFSIVVHNYLQRYIPELNEGAVNIAKMINQRNSSTIFVDNDQTLKDAIQYYNLDPQKICRIPFLLSIIKKDKLCGNNEKYNCTGKEYFVWDMVFDKRDNIVVGLKALIEYYEQGGSFDCAIIKVRKQFVDCRGNLNVENVNEAEYERLKHMLDDSQLLSAHVHFFDNTAKKDSAKIIREAKFLFHSRYGDSDVSNIVDAVCLQVPVLCGEHPMIKGLADFLEVKMLYTSPFDYKEMCLALLDMENNHKKYAECMTDDKQIEEKDYIWQAEQLCQCLKNNIGF